jgi:Rieske Fe-S protein
MSTLLKQSLLYPKRFVTGRLQKSTVSPTDFQPDSGGLVEVEGRKIALYKNAKGKEARLSPVCTHLGCIVDFNQKDKTWDCPCHGSRYKADGTVFNGPAKKNLKKI